MSPPILAFSSREGQFILDTDVSNHGVGAALSQLQDEGGRVVAYYNRVFSKSERNYCVTRRELLAVVDAVRSFYHYLYGRKFIIRTDHVSLRWLMSFRNLEGQLARWLERLEQYDFDVRYRGGKAHGNADSLSRRPCLEASCRYCSKMELAEESAKDGMVGRLVFIEDHLQKWRAAQLNDAVLSRFLRAKEESNKPDWQEIAPLEASSKIYWLQWDALVTSDGVLFKKWESPCLQKHIL